MPRTSSAVLKGGSSKAVKAAEKLKAVKADLKSAEKELKAAQKAVDKAQAQVDKLTAKVEKLTAKNESTETIVAPEETEVVEVQASGAGVVVSA